MDPRAQAASSGLAHQRLRHRLALRVAEVESVDGAERVMPLVDRAGSGRRIADADARHEVERRARVAREAQQLPRRQDVDVAQRVVAGDPVDRGAGVDDRVDVTDQGLPDVRVEARGRLGQIASYHRHPRPASRHRLDPGVSRQAGDVRGRALQQHIEDRRAEEAGRAGEQYVPGFDQRLRAPGCARLDLGSEDGVRAHAVQDVTTRRSAERRAQRADRRVLRHGIGRDGDPERQLELTRQLEAPQ